MKNLVTMSEFYERLMAATEPWTEAEKKPIVEEAQSECRRRAGVVWVGNDQTAWAVSVN